MEPSDDSAEGHLAAIRNMAAGAARGRTVASPWTGALALMSGSSRDEATRERFPATALLSEAQMSQVRRYALLGVLGGTTACQALAARGLWHEPEQERILLGVLGLLCFTVALAGVLHRSMTPRRGWNTAIWRLTGLVVVLMSVPLVGPVGDERWPTWAFLGAAIVGAAPVLLPVPAAVGLAVVAVLVTAATAWWQCDPVGSPVAVTVVLGLSVALSSRLHLWFRERLEIVRASGVPPRPEPAVAPEQSRITGDGYHVLGDLLWTIVLKAELASRHASADWERAGREVSEVRAIASAALSQVRALVNDHRVLDLREQLLAVERVLRASGVRCTVTRARRDVPDALGAQLAPVLRVAGFQALQHSTARWCTIKVGSDNTGARLTVVNDGVVPDGAAIVDGMLAEAASRLREAGGTVHVRRADGTFTLEATARAEP